jgi:hypothetical protein
MTDKPGGFDDDEPPTKPDNYRTKCPNCTDASGTPSGYVEEEEWIHGSLHRQIRRTCEVCWGKKWIDRAALTRWAQRNL